MDAKFISDPQRSSGGLPDATTLIDFDTVGDWVPLAGLLPTPFNDRTRTTFDGGYSAIGTELAAVSRDRFRRTACSSPER